VIYCVVLEAFCAAVKQNLARMCSGSGLPKQRMVADELWFASGGWRGDEGIWIADEQMA